MITIARAKAPLFRAGMKPAPEGLKQLQGCPAACGGEDVTLKQDGFIKALQGITTLEEVLRVARE